MTHLSNKWLAIALFNLALAIGLGAFGAHALRDTISAEAMAWFKTGHDYHMWQGIGLLIMAAALANLRWIRVSLVLTLVGTVLFCGSLYLMSVTGLRWLGAITPLGGLSWIIAWCLLGISALKRTDESGLTAD